MSSKKDEKKILIDSDVIRHFIDADRIFDLPKIFPKRIVVVDVVRNELCRSKRLRQTVINFISMCKIEDVKLEDNLEALIEYSKLLNFAGEGEAACMALAKVESKYIASSNLKDIADYCKNYGIKIITTMDFLYEAFMNKLYTEEECDIFINSVLEKGNKLPTKNISDYVKKYRM